MLADLSERARVVFRHIIDIYCETGEPVGSHTLAQRMGMTVSSATIRNVMVALESMGLLYSPHTSSGRVPTETGLRVFVQGLLQVGPLTPEDELSLNKSCEQAHWNIPGLLEQAISSLSGLTRCAGLVVSPRGEAPIKHIEFLSLGGGKCLVILAFTTGAVENRIIILPSDPPVWALAEASRFLNMKCAGLTIHDAREHIKHELEANRHEIDTLSNSIVEAGLGIWSGNTGEETFIIKGQAHLLEDVQHLEDLERLRILFTELETRENLLRLLDASAEADGVQIFIGSDNPLFDLAGCSMIVAPYRDARQKIIGAVGVLGPRHLNYARIVPMVDYTARILTRFVG